MQKQIILELDWRDWGIWQETWVMIVNILPYETTVIFATCHMCIKYHCSKYYLAYQRLYIQTNNILFNLCIYDFIFTIQGCVNIRIINFLFKVYMYPIITHPFQKLVCSMNTKSLLNPIINTRYLLCGSSDHSSFHGLCWLSMW